MRAGSSTIARRCGGCRWCSGAIVFGFSVAQTWRCPLSARALRGEGPGREPQRLDSQPPTSTVPADSTPGFDNFDAGVPVFKQCDGKGRRDSSGLGHDFGLTTNTWSRKAFDDQAVPQKLGRQTRLTTKSWSRFRFNVQNKEVVVAHARVLCLQPVRGCASRGLDAKHV